ncbi:MAG: glycosyltransferase, partial [bacterium]
KYGIIVPYRDTRAMANAAKDVLLHPEKYKPMMKVARQWVLQNNTLEREIADKLKIYRAVLGE